MPKPGGGGVSNATLEIADVVFGLLLLAKLYTW